MKKIATKLMISVLSVALALIALGTSTFAWFSMNTTVTANGMELTATTPVNLLIKNSASGTYANIATADEDFGESKLYPSSTADGKTRFNAIVNSGNYINNGEGGVAEDDTKFQISSDQTGSEVIEITNSSNGYWATYTFALHLSEPQETPEDVYLSTLKFYTKYTSDGTETSDGTAYSYVDGIFTAIDNGETIPSGNYYKMNGIANAARCALYTGATEGSLTTLVGIYSNVADNTTKPVTTAITENETLYSTIKASNNTVVASEVASDSHTFQVNGEDVFVTLVVWIEGQDADCINANAGQTFKIEVAFKTII